MLATISGVKYDPEATSELWERFIDDVTQGDKDTAIYLQKAMGYGLTGDTSEECFFTLYGATTRNGKGTLMETYMALVGGYGRAARPETIAQKDKTNSNAPTEDIARLAGARVVNISEPGKQMVLSASLVKTLTGRDTINARFLNENSFEFVPQFKLFINTNHLPKVTDPTVFDSGRVKVVPFNRHFSEEEQDKTLKRRLRQTENLSGILNWCLDGLRLLQETGLDAPRTVREATAQYRRDSDKIARFVDEMMEKTQTERSEPRKHTEPIKTGASATGTVRRVCQPGNRRWRPMLKSCARDRRELAGMQTGFGIYWGSECGVVSCGQGFPRGKYFSLA